MFKKSKKEQVKEYKQRKKLEENYKELKKKKSSVEERLEIIEKILDLGE
jgi:hypothetical protein